MTGVTKRVNSSVEVLKSGLDKLNNKFKEM